MRRFSALDTALQRRELLVSCQHIRGVVPVLGGFEDAYRVSSHWQGIAVPVPMALIKELNQSGRLIGRPLSFYTLTDSFVQFIFQNRFCKTVMCIIYLTLRIKYSLRATTRIIREMQGGCSINTITKLLEEVGEACAWYQDKHLVTLPCKRVQVDEIWSFVYSKQKNTPEELKGENGDVWTWTAICADTKLVPSWRIGSRDAEIAHEFIGDLASRMNDRIQLTSDGYKKYENAVEAAFGADIDYAMLVKIYGDAPEGQKRYSPAQCSGIINKVVTGSPDQKHVSTSYVERQNLTMRMSMRRFTRLTNAFSKKLDNHAHAIALHFMHYNFVRIHKSLKVSPAMAAGASETLWSLEDVVKMADDYWNEKNNSN